VVPNLSARHHFVLVKLTTKDELITKD